MFQPLQMGVGHMLGQDSYVPLMQNNFEIRVYGMGGDAPTENANLLTLSTSEIGNIQEDQDVITVHYGNGQIKFPAKTSFQDVDWTLNCYCEPNVYQALRDWRKQVYDPDTERMGLPSAYMRTVYFIRYDGSGRKARDIIKCPGVWPRGVDNGSMNQEGGIVTVKTTLVISRAIYLTGDQISSF